MSDGVIGHSSQLAYNAITDATTITNYTTIGNIISVSGPDETRNPVDVSTMESALKWMEFIPGLLDGGEITLEVNYDGTASGDADTLNTKLTADTDAWMLKIPSMDGSGDTTSVFSRFTMAGFVTGLGTQTPHDDKITQSVTIKVTGPVAYTDE